MTQPPLPADWVDLLAVQRLQADYAAALDGARWDDWVELFTEGCVYRIWPRENFDRGLPLATLALEGKPMLRDRVYGLRETLFHDPYHQRHLIGPPRLLPAAPGDDAAATLRCESNYLVVRTKHAEPSEILNAGRYLDRLERQPDGRLLIGERLCVFDSALIPNSLIYPI